jgi:hypothetical protein
MPIGQLCEHFVPSMNGLQPGRFRCRAVEIRYPASGGKVEKSLSECLDHWRELRDESFAPCNKPGCVKRQQGASSTTLNNLKKRRTIHAISKEAPNGRFPIS